RLNDFMHDLSERLKSSLVQIRVRRAVEPQEGQEQQPNAPNAPDERRSSGSGFIIREDGYLVTNAHVVGDAERIQVRLSDGRRFDAKLIGLDERVDLALLKIEASGLPVAQLGDSNRARVGEFVLALGHPFGLEQTVSFGIVSRKGAPLQVATPGFEFIQTDAAVNPGNSGGPLVNMAGEVIGINSMAAVNGSIGFAIPVNLVKALLPQLAEKGKVEWGWLGVTIAEVPDDDVAKFGLKEAKGVLIRQVVAGQPADQGGMRANDVVLSVDGSPVEGPPDLQRIISSTPVGKIVRISLMREGKETEVAVKVGAYQAGPRAPRRVVPGPTPRQPSPQQPPQPPR
ncbi:MAG TPA: trypsin-like peptidase domain-containing protein, partial [Candidatus Dormibacteraeota bacterium]|nr:trypsin-like peptidase domain-containing protein [Candidatus Dormibacteraeota bacterium]